MQTPVPLRLSTKTALDLPQHLLRGQVVSQEQLAQAEEVAKHTGQAVADVLVELRFVSDEDIARGVAALTGTPFVDLRSFDIPADVIEIVPESVARENQIVSIAFDDGTLTLAMIDPNEPDTIAKLQFIFNTRIAVRVAAASAIHDTIDRHYVDEEGNRRTAEPLIQEFVCTRNASSWIFDPSRLETQPTDSGMVNVGDFLLIESVIFRASQIILTTEGEFVGVRFIIYGAEQNRPSFFPPLEYSDLKRLEMLAQLDLADRTGIQSGTIRMLFGSEEYEFQIHFSHKPTATSILIVAPRAAGNDDPEPVQKWWAEARS